MADITRRRKFRYDRVMIESARILNPQFDDAVIHLSGAQVELLRNVSQYLRRLETYVAVYHLGYYLVPTDEEYDALMVIVANLEEKLMGNENTIWGYNDIVADAKSRTKSGDGTFQEWGDAVPEGVVWVIQHVSMTNKTGDRGIMRIEVSSAAQGQIWLLNEPDPGQSAQVFKGPIVLVHTDLIKWIQEGSLNGDQYELGLSGYSMVIPT